MSQDAMASLAVQVKQAFTDATPLRIVGGDSKSQLGRAVDGQPLDVGAHRGIVEYQPTELVITARAGTPLKEVEAVLAESGQMFSFEPPHLGETATLGGMLACGLSGPRRPHTCASRDSTLGVKMINGRGEVLQFGGQVMKNVAGYDISRLMVGAQGTIGVLLDISLKVLPRPAHEQTLQVEMDAVSAVNTMVYLSSAAVPLSAACHLPETAEQAGRLCLRLSGAEAAVVTAVSEIRNELSAFSISKMAEDEAVVFWQDLRERRLPFFFADPAQNETAAVWRVSLPPATPAFEQDDLPGDCLIDWAGAQRWLKTDTPVEVVQAAVEKLGGHAALYEKESAILAPLSPALAAVHGRVKNAFDPQGILNPGRLYDFC
jgi:glycolate oxidase FAD binding subunit